MHQGVVAVGDGVDGEAADAGPGEDRFGDDGSGEQRAELQAEDGEDGDHGVAQGVAVDDGALGQAFGAGGADVVLAELFEHGGADHAGEDGGERSAHGDGGEDEVARSEPAPETGSQPSLMEKSRIRMGPRAKLGNDRPKRLTTLRARSSQRLRRWAERTPAGIDKDDRDEQRGQRELQRVGIALGDEVRDAVVEAEGVAEVAVEDAVPVVDVLLAERGVEAVGVARGLDVGGGRAFAEHLQDGVSGDEVDQQEDEGDDQPDDWQGVEDALEKRLRINVVGGSQISGPSTPHLMSPFGNDHAPVGR